MISTTVTYWVKSNNGQDRHLVSTTFQDEDWDNVDFMVSKFLDELDAGGEGYPFSAFNLVKMPEPGIAVPVALNDPGKRAIPNCPIHGGEMRESRRTKKGALVSFFCPEKDEGGYCKVIIDRYPNQDQKRV